MFVVPVKIKKTDLPVESEISLPAVTERNIKADTSDSEGEDYEDYGFEEVSPNSEDEAQLTDDNGGKSNFTKETNGMKNNSKTFANTGTKHSNLDPYFNAFDPKLEHQNFKVRF